MPGEPRVTIGLPVYNGGRYIAESIKSVLDQDFDGLELVICDNASTDDTVTQVGDLIAGDSRARLLHNEVNRGAAFNYNRVFHESSGEFFRWHAHDDLFEPGLLSACVPPLDEDSGLVLSYSWTRFVDDDGVPERDFVDDLGVTSERPHERLASVIPKLTFCNAAFSVIRRDQLARTSLIRAYPGSDVGLLYELAVVGRFHVVPAFLFTRRPGNSIRSNPGNRAVAEWFSPDRSGARLPGLHLLAATLDRIWRLDLPLNDRVRTSGVFLAEWPIDHARRLRRRRRRQKAASEATA